MLHMRANGRPKMNEDPRRTFLLGVAGTGLLVVGCAASGRGDAKAAVGENGDEGVTPPEDLMREHGVLSRILLVYEESARRLDAEQPLSVDALAKSADII